MYKLIRGIRLNPLNPCAYVLMHEVHLSIAVRCTLQESYWVPYLTATNIAGASAGNWRLRISQGGVFKIQEFNISKATNGGWQLAAGGSGFHRGEVFKIQEFNISKATNGGWRLAAGGSGFHRGGDSRFKNSRIQD